MSKEAEDYLSEQGIPNFEFTHLSCQNDLKDDIEFEFKLSRTLEAYHKMKSKKSCVHKEVVGIRWCYKCKECGEIIEEEN